MPDIKKIAFQMGALLFMALLLVSFTHLGHEKANAAENPGPRWGHVFIYHPIQKKILLFGGTRKRGDPYLDDTWVWENGKWQQLDVPGPSARGFCAATFHKQRETVVLHGGRGNEGVTYSDMLMENKSRWMTFGPGMDVNGVKLNIIVDNFVENALSPP